MLLGEPRPNRSQFFNFWRRKTPKQTEIHHEGVGEERGAGGVAEDLCFTVFKENGVCSCGAARVLTLRRRDSKTTRAPSPGRCLASI